ncbi:MAG: alpha/beta hydrolase [Anaerolineae bacterium]|nr:alpha/beta hydrolase [Anaerolineae bacterium]
MPTIQIDQQQMFYQVVGESNTGDPLLLLHGWVQIGNDLLPLAHEIARRGFRVILPDLPGYGKSVLPYRTFPADFYQRDAALMCAFADALGLKDVHIMGFSDGGEIALLMPILRPDLCRTVIAWGAIGSFPLELCESQRRGLPHTWITDQHRAKHPGQDIDQWPAQWVAAFCAVIEQQNGDVSLSRAHTIRCPLLIILGDQDGLNPADRAYQFVARIPDQRGSVHVFPGVGHYVHTQNPLGFLTAIAAFWDRSKQRET